MIRATALFTLFVAAARRRRGARPVGAAGAGDPEPDRARRRGPHARPRRPCPARVGAIEAAVGQEAKVALYPGRPILDSQLGAPALVERNAMVRMTYASGPLRIVTEGRALDRAGAGEPVRVMNLASRQTVTGTVAADGSIEVGQP